MSLRLAEFPVHLFLSPLIIRPEEPKDYAAVRAVNEAAFETPAEADLVEKLRAEAEPIISLVAETADGVVGHILFSPVELSGHSELKIMGLAPMAVAPSSQRQGIGSRLVVEVVHLISVRSSCSDIPTTTHGLVFFQRPTSEFLLSTMSQERCSWC